MGSFYELRWNGGLYRLNRLSRRLLKPRSLVQFVVLLLVLYICYILGLFTHILERDLAEFRYPLKIDINIAIKTLRRDEASSQYLDVNKFNFTFIHDAPGVCEPVGTRRPYMVILVKSKYSHFEHRAAVRETWGKRDSQGLIRTVFLIGVPSPEELELSEQELEADTSSEHHQHDDLAPNPHSRDREKAKLPKRQSQVDENVNDDFMRLYRKGKNQSIYQKIELENQKHGDLVQQDFYDTYYNNTLKTLMGLRWVNDLCTESTYYLFIDDDYYLNPNLLVQFLEANVTRSSRASSTLSTLYAGFVFPNSAPMRHILSKWYISLKEYPYNRYPPYVSAGCYVMSLESVRLFYMASKLIEAFKLDDIYMGILAHKLDVKPMHIENIYFYPPAYDAEFFAKSVIASHQFEKEALRTIWTELESSIKFNGLPKLPPKSNV